MHLVGYAWLREAMQLSAFPLRLPAIVQPVTRLKKIGQTLAVPPATAPAPDDLLGHMLFALKHEGINLAILAQALPKIPVTTLEQALQEAPNGIYIRKACYLREAFTKEEVLSKRRFEALSYRSSTPSATSPAQGRETRDGG